MAVDAGFDVHELSELARAMYRTATEKYPKEARKFLNEHFSAALTEQSVETFISVDSMKYAHATIATGWQTAYFVRRFNNTDNKFYFVQDFEPIFFGVGSR